MRDQDEERDSMRKRQKRRRKKRHDEGCPEMSVTVEGKEEQQERPATQGAWQV